jgi:hypothetical protein
MDDDEHPAENIQPERHESEFALGVRILSRATFGIAQSHLGLAERDPVLEQVAPGLRGVEFDEYRLSIHIKCISTNPSCDRN